MKNSKGLGVIRIGDKTSHGGQVTSSQAAFIVLGKQVAVAGDMTFCPKCKGFFPIKVSNSERQHHCKAVAFQGDKSACGADLISSL